MNETTRWLAARGLAARSALGIVDASPDNKGIYSAARAGSNLKAAPLRTIREEMQAMPGPQASPDSISESSGP